MSAAGTIQIACAVEGAYDAHSAAMLHSATANRGDLGLHVHYLHGPDFPRESVGKIAAMLDGLEVDASFHEIADREVADLPVISMFTAAMWYRIFLPELVDAERVLYLDVDTIVADDLTPLWTIDLEGRPLGAVANVFQLNHVHRPADLGLEGTQSYFNSGVLLMDLNLIRRTGALRDVYRNACSRGSELEWPDQDALNLGFEGQWHRLHPRWNVMNSFRFPQSQDSFSPGEVAAARAHPGIRHFEGPGDNKPWHPDCTRDNRELYLTHRKQTPWPDLPSTPPAERLRQGIRRAWGKMRRART